MSASNDELLLFNAAKSGDLTKLKELLSKGVATGYRDEVRVILLYLVIQVIFIILLLMMIMMMMMLMCVASINLQN